MTQDFCVLMFSNPLVAALLSGEPDFLNYASMPIYIEIFNSLHCLLNSTPNLIIYISIETKMLCHLPELFLYIFTIIV